MLTSVSKELDAAVTKAETYLDIQQAVPFIGRPVHSLGNRLYEARRSLIAKPPMPN